MDADRQPYCVIGHNSAAPLHQPTHVRLSVCSYYAAEQRAQSLRDYGYIVTIKHTSFVH